MDGGLDVSLVLGKPKSKKCLRWFVFKRVQSNEVFPELLTESIRKMRIFYIKFESCFRCHYFTLHFSSLYFYLF